MNAYQWLSLPTTIPNKPQLVLPPFTLTVVSIQLPPSSSSLKHPLPNQLQLKRCCLSGKTTSRSPRTISIRHKPINRRMQTSIEKQHCLKKETKFYCQPTTLWL